MSNFMHFFLLKQCRKTSVNCVKYTYMYSKQSIVNCFGNLLKFWKHQPLMIFKKMACAYNLISATVNAIEIIY